MEALVRVRWVFGVFLCLLAATSSAYADGKVFRTVSAVVPMVDQEAVICFKDGVELLAIRTRAAAAGTGDEPLAWVVPVPGPDAPELLTCTDGVFATARTLTQPRLLQHDGPEPGWVLLLLALFLLAAVASVRLIDGVSTRQRALLGVLVVFIGFVCAGGLLLPSLGRARSSPAGGPTTELVDVLKQERVGTLEVTVVRAKPGLDSAQALASWLKQAGCAVPAAVEPALADYAVRNWVFVAARLARGKGTERLEPTPLVMRFPAKTPVYPMKLTGVGNGPLELELIVLADGTASAPGMTTARSSPLRGEGAEYDRDAVSLEHEGLKSLAAKVGGSGGSGGVRWISRLTGRLSPARQASDMAIQIEPGARFGETLYTREGAASLGADCGAGVAALGIAALTIAICVRRFTNRSAWTLLACSLSCGVLAGFTIAATVATYSGPVRSSRSSYRAMREIESVIGSLGTHDLNSLRAAIAASRDAGVEPFASLPVESDVPWGYTLRQDDRGEVWVDLYNSRGAADRGYPLSILTR